MVNPEDDPMTKQSEILIVDDDRQNRQLLEVVLRAEGYRTVEAESGEAALDAVMARMPDLILLDIMMPGMNGYQVTETIKNNSATKNIPIILVTALDDQESKMNGLRVGAEDFLTKPIDRSELCMRVRNLLRLKAYGDFYGKYSHQLEVEADSRQLDLVESLGLYRSTFDAAPVGIVHVGLSGEWRRVNQRLCDFLGYAPDELEGIALSRLMTPADIASDTEALRQITAGELDRHVSDERQYRRRDGRTVFVKVHTSLHRNVNGDPQHFIVVVEDIDEQRSLEAQVRQAGKMDAIGKLASGVAHDFNNLLTVILGFAELASTDSAMASEHRDELDEIKKAAKRAAGLTGQLLAFSRQQVLHASSLDVNALITDMAAMLTRLIGEHIEVSLHLAPDLHPAFADGGQLEQVVMNLVVNARDAMPDGGRITIDTANVELENSPFHHETVVEGEYVMIAICDTGGGMTPETKLRLFEPFFTTKNVGDGTGLGLSTTYGIVKQSKGYIWVYSELGRGTNFKVYLPRAVRNAAVGVDVLPPPSVGRAAGTVLLVEDEAAVRRLSKRILERAGYTVIEADCGDRAEEVYQHAGSVDLVITDVIMPGCGGPELMERLRLRTPGLKALYTSGYTDNMAQYQSQMGPGVPFIQKPFTAAEFCRQVRAALDLETSSAQEATA